MASFSLSGSATSMGSVVTMDRNGQIHSLQSIAWIVHSSVRHGDLVARVASDEVEIYLPNATMENVNKICERIRARVYETTFIAGQERQISVTVRFGGTRVGTNPPSRHSARLPTAALAEEEAGPLLFRELFS